MASKARGIVVGGLVVAAVLQAEHEAPGATGRSAAQLRNAAAPAASEVIGAAGDAVLIARDELSRQGIDPTAVLQDPATAETERDANGIEGG